MKETIVNIMPTKLLRWSIIGIALAAGVLILGMNFETARGQVSPSFGAFYDYDEDVIVG